VILSQPLLFSKVKLKGLAVKLSDLHIGLSLHVIVEFQRGHAQILKVEDALFDADGIRRLVLKAVELDIEIDRAQLAFRSYEGDLVVKIVASYVHSLKMLKPKGDRGTPSLSMMVDFEGDPVELMRYIVMMRGQACALGIATAQEKFDLRPSLEADVVDPNEPKAQADGSVSMSDEEGNPITLDGDVWANLVNSLSSIGKPDTDTPRRRTHCWRGTGRVADGDAPNTKEKRHRPTVPPAHENS
jgi:hypothetical protein